jgi:hypothetical protein
MPPYAAMREARRNHSSSGTPQGDPVATAQAILTVVDAPTPPLRLFLGAALLGIVRATYEQRLKTWEQWDEVARAAQGN